MRHPNFRFFAVLFAAAALILAVPFLTRADEGWATYKNYNAASQSVLGARAATGAQLGYWDPAVSGSLDTGYVDTSGCSAGCLAVMVEAENATTAASCQTYGAYDRGGGTIVSAAMGSAVSITAESASWGNSVCPGAAGSGGGLQFPLPKYVRVYCAAATGVNVRGFMSCH